MSCITLDIVSITAYFFATTSNVSNSPFYGAWKSTSSTIIIEWMKENYRGGGTWLRFPTSFYWFLEINMWESQTNLGYYSRVVCTYINIKQTHVIFSLVSRKKLLLRPCLEETNFLPRSLIGGSQSILSLAKKFLI